MNTKLAAILPDDSLKAVLDQNAPLKLNSGALNTFAACPRQFFYQSLLNLPSPSHASAEWGRLWHSIMEVFHQDPNPGPSLLRHLVAEVSEQEPRTAARWPEKSLVWLDSLPGLQRRDALRKLERVRDNMLDNPTFLLSASTKDQALVEEKLTLKLEEANTTFNMRLDLAFKTAANHWHIVDYKTYGAGKFNAKKAETLLQHLTHALDSFPQRDTEATHRAQFPYPGTKPLINQLPLYWLAAQQRNWLVEAFSLSILRDQAPCLHVTANLPAVEAMMPAFAEALTQWINHEIRPTTWFQPVTDNNPCGLCAYTAVCPRAADDPDNRLA